MAALAIFVVADVALVALAFSLTRETPSSTRYLVPSAHPQPSATPTPTPPTVVAAPVRRSLAVAGESTVWRAEGGSCAAGDAPLLQTSTDAGASWADRDIARYDVRQVLALSVRDANFGTAVVKLGDGCELAGFRSFTGGQFWERADDVLADFTYLDPDEVSTVIIAGERVESPCPDAVQATVSGGQAVVLCGEGVAFARSGDSWSSLPAQPGGVAIVTAAPVMEFAHVAGSECPLALGFSTDDGERSERGCAPAPEEGERTVSVASGSRTWVWVGGWFGVI